MQGNVFVQMFYIGYIGIQRKYNLKKLLYVFIWQLLDIIITL